MLSNKKLIQTGLISICVLAFLFLPLISFGKGLVPCGGAGEPPCDWNQLMDLIYRLMRFILIKLSIPIAAVMFAIAGLRMLFGGGAEAFTKFKHTFMGILIGLFWIAFAWLAIKYFFLILGYKGAWIGF